MLEHVPVPDDVAVLKELWRVLKPCGELILTLPVVSKGYDEFRKNNIYGLSRNSSASNGSFFFQRWYDDEMLSDKVLRHLENVVVRRSCVYGEREKGWYADYESNWLKYGEQITCKDAFYCAVNYANWAKIKELPGSGVLGLMLGKKIL